MHPEATPDRQVVRWVVPAGTLPVVGAMAGAPAGLGDLMRAGPIASIDVESRAVVIRLAAGSGWAVDGVRVRDALAEALQQPQHWQPAGVVTEDDRLRAALQEVLDGPAGGYIRSHGGKAVIVSAHDRRADVRMTGACSHCPAAGFTLHSRLESELRKLFPQLVELRATEEDCGPDRPGRPTWLSVRRHRT